MNVPAQGRSRRREELLDAADRVVLAQGPGASMAAFAAEAGITKPILYRHFGDKGGLYRALAERYADPLAEVMREVITGPGTRRQRTQRAIAAYLTFIEGSPQVYRFLMHRALAEQPEAHTAVSAVIRRIGEDIGEALQADADLDAETARAWGHGMTGMVQVAGDWWLEHRTVDREVLVGQLIDLLWGGLRALPDAPPAAQS